MERVCYALPALMEPLHIRALEQSGCRNSLWAVSCQFMLVAQAMRDVDSHVQDGGGRGPKITKSAKRTASERFCGSLQGINIR